MALILLMLLVFVGRFEAWWGPHGADVAHFDCFSLVLGGWRGLRPRPLCGCGPLVGLILLILFVFRWFG